MQTASDGNVERIAVRESTPVTASRPGFLELPKFNLEAPAGKMPASTARATHPTQMVRTHAQEAEACPAALGATRLTRTNDSVLFSSQPNKMRHILPSSATPGQGTTP